MSKKLYSLTVRGTYHTWSFDIYANPQHVAEWREDGIEVDEIVNTIPVFIANIKLTRVWCFLQDLFYFKNPFQKQ